MGYIANLFVKKLVDIATTNAPDGRKLRWDLLRAARMQPTQPFPGDGMIEDKHFFRLLETVAEEQPDGRAMGVRVGATMRCDDYGAFGLAFKAAVDLHGSFQRVERYGKVVTNLANVSVHPGPTTTFLAVPTITDPRLGQIMTDELAIAAATALSREVTDSALTPVYVSFAHEAPTEYKEIQDYFGCPVHFGADRNGLELSNEQLSQTNTLGDRKFSEFFAAHLDRELDAFVDDSQLAVRVKIRVTSALSEGTPRLSDVAGDLGMSGRTLQRQLAKAGHSYQELVEAAQQELASTLLSDTDYALAEVAFLSGYTDQSAFSRAFRRWRGRTPAAYRRATRH